jgi:hypothetical protein
VTVAVAVSSQNYVTYEATFNVEQAPQGVLTVDGVHPCSGAGRARTEPVGYAANTPKCPPYTHGNLMLAECMAQGFLQL